MNLESMRPPPTYFRSSLSDMFLQRVVLKGDVPISIKLLCNCPKIALRHGCSPVNFLSEHLCRTASVISIHSRLLLQLQNT